MDASPASPPPTGKKPRRSSVTTVTKFPEFHWVAQGLLTEIQRCFGQTDPPLRSPGANANLLTGVLATGGDVVRSGSCGAFRVTWCVQDGDRSQVDSPGLLGVSASCWAL